MKKWTVEVSWTTTVEAEDEGDALMEADRHFDFMVEADATEEDSDFVDDNDDENDEEI